MAVTLTTEITVPKSVRRKAGLKLLDRVGIKVVGRKTSTGDFPIETITKIIKAAKNHPMSPCDGQALDAELMAYGSKQAKKLGIKERDIPSIIHDSRARRRTL